jgi:drug/metabolite transporter (DMT)-like permease
MSITVVLSLLYGFYTRIPHFPFGHFSVRRLLVIRGVGGFFGVFGLYWSLLYLPLAEATVLTFLAPILTCYACSILIQGETFSRQQQAAGFLSLVGVVFIARPGNFLGHSSSSPSGGSGTSGAAGPSNTTLPLSSASPSPSSMTTKEVTVTPHQHLLAVLYAMLGVLGATTAMTTIRKIGTRAHPLISVNYFSTWCTIVSLVAVLVVRSVGFRLPRNVQEWALLAMLGVFGFVMQFLLTAGLSYGGPAMAEAGRPQISNWRATSQNASIDEEAGRRTRTTAAAASPAKPSSGTRATSMLYTQMLFALAFDKWIWGISPGWSSWVGSAIILACAVWVAAARDLQKTKEEGKPQEETFDETSEVLGSANQWKGEVKGKSRGGGHFVKQQEQEEQDEEEENEERRLITRSPPAIGPETREQDED